MREKLLTLLKNLQNNESNFEDIEKVFSLYEQLQYSLNVKSIAQDIFKWLNTHFKIENVSIELFNIATNDKELILKSGEDFYLDDETTSFFIINTNTNLNAIVSFGASSQEHFDFVDLKRDLIDSTFYLISPIIQSAILKKNQIESSSIDSVTNVYNRTFFIKHLKKFISIKKDIHENIFFLMIGIDHFKAVIDEFNYEIGDRVLIELAKVIHSNIKEFDTVARLTGDEFLVSLINYDSIEEIDEIASRIIEDFKKIRIDVDLTNQFLQKTICIGISNYNKNTDDNLDTSIKNSDIALYEAKNKGRSQYEHYNLHIASSIDLF